VSAEPDVFGPLARRDLELLIVACDGVWDVISDDDAMAVVWPLRADPEAAAVALRDVAFRRGSTDNISLVVIVLPSAFNAPPDDSSSSTDDLLMSPRRRARKHRTHRRRGKGSPLSLSRHSNTESFVARFFLLATTLTHT
jgi:serine/threonine protein phosphatase PrpC